MSRVPEMGGWGKRIGEERKERCRSGTHDDGVGVVQGRED